LIRTIDGYNAAWREWFTSYVVVPHLVGYEDLAADMVAVTEGILDFLGLDPLAGDPVVAQHERQADQLNEEWAARYRAATVAR
jgi:trehalose 2-sulfotransferase